MHSSQGHPHHVLIAVERRKGAAKKSKIEEAIAVLNEFTQGKQQDTSMSCSLVGSEYWHYCHCRGELEC